MASRCKYGRTKKGTCRKAYKRRSTGGLGGAARTCKRYTCVPGRGKAPSDRCPKGTVLRCKKYLPKAGRAPLRGQRKGYAQYIYGRALPGRHTIRGKYKPAVGGRPLRTSEEMTRR